MAGEGREPSGPGPGSLDAAVGLSPGRGGEETGLPSPAQPWAGRWGRSGQERAGAAAPRGQTAGTHGLSHTHRTHNLGSHMWRCRCVCACTHTHIRYTRTRAHPAHTRHRHSQLTRAHTITHVHTYPAPPAQDLTLTVCTHSNAYRQMQGYAYTQLTHAGIGAHPTHTQT